LESSQRCALSLGVRANVEAKRRFDVRMTQGSLNDCWRGSGVGQRSAQPVPKGMESNLVLEAQAAQVLVAAQTSTRSLACRVALNDLE
jgi:hypothetical protein